MRLGAGNVQRVAGRQETLRDVGGERVDLPLPRGSERAAIRVDGRNAAERNRRWNGRRSRRRSKRAVTLCTARRKCSGCVAPTDQAVSAASTSASGVSASSVYSAGWLWATVTCPSARDRPHTVEAPQPRRRTV